MQEFPTGGIEVSNGGTAEAHKWLTNLAFEDAVCGSMRLGMSQGNHQMGNSTKIPASINPWDACGQWLLSAQSGHEASTRQVGNKHSLQLREFLPVRALTVIHCG
jgi:hypothetical protein